MAAQTPEEVDSLFEKFANAGDLDGLMTLYEPGATLNFGAPATGLMAIRQVLHGVIGANPKISLNVTSVIPGGDDVALVYASYELSMDGPDGNRQQLSGKTVEVMRKQTDDTWLFVIDDPNGRSPAP